MTDNTTQKKPAGSDDDVLPVISDARDRRLNTLRRLRDFADETAGSGDELVEEAFARLPDVTADEVRELTRDFDNEIERLQSVVEIIDEAADTIEYEGEGARAERLGEESESHEQSIQPVMTDRVEMLADLLGDRRYRSDGHRPSKGPPVSAEQVLAAECQEHIANAVDDEARPRGTGTGA